MTSRLDGSLTNALTGLGTSIDPRQATAIRPSRELSRGEIDALVAGFWEAQKFVEVLPQEALRKWITLVVDGGPDDAARMILDDLEEKRVRQQLQMALIFERQYGGSVLLLGVSEADSAEQPLDLDNIETGGFKFVEPYSRWKVSDPSTLPLIEDKSDPRYGLPEIYEIQTDLGSTPIRVHHTRVIVFQGWSPQERDFRYEWGRSVLDRFWPPLREYENAVGYGVSLGSRLVETRLKIKGLTEMLAGNPDARDKARKMLQEIAAGRSTFRILMVDSEDAVEDTSISFTGYADLIKVTQDNLAAASGLSAQRFFGFQQQGLSNNDNTGAERDDALVAAYQRDALLPVLNRLIEISVASLGLKIKSWQVRFEELREETPLGKAQRRLAESTASKTYTELSAVTPDEVRETLRADPDSPYQLQDGPAPEKPALVANPIRPDVNIPSPGAAFQHADEEEHEDASTPTGTTYFRWSHNYVGPNPRPLHVARDGQIFRWDRLPGPFHESPGEWDYCRCSAEPVSYVRAVAEIALHKVGLRTRRGKRTDGSDYEEVESIEPEEHSDGELDQSMFPALWKAMDPVSAELFSEAFSSMPFPETEEQLFETLVEIAPRALYREPEWVGYQESHPGATEDDFVIERIYASAWEVFDYIQSEPVEPGTEDAYDQPRHKTGRYVHTGGAQKRARTAKARSIASARAGIDGRRAARMLRLEGAMMRAREIVKKRRVKA